jgi:hypothetical protein
MPEATLTGGRPQNAMKNPKVMAAITEIQVRPLRSPTGIYTRPHPSPSLSALIAHLPPSLPMQTYPRTHATPTRSLACPPDGGGGEGGARLALTPRGGAQRDPKKAAQYLADPEIGSIIAQLRQFL